jgi:hypothetical protein
LLRGDDAADRPGIAFSCQNEWSFASDWIGAETGTGNGAMVELRGDSREHLGKLGSSWGT